MTRYLYLLPWWGKKEKVCGNDALIVTQMFAIKTEDFSYFPPCWRKKAKFVAKKQIQYVAETSSAMMRCLYLLSWCGVVTRAGSEVLAGHQIRLQTKELKMFHLLPNVDKHLNMCRHPLE